MATDYAAPRKNEEDTDSIEAIKERVPTTTATNVDDDADNPGSFDLSAADLTDVELETIVLPAQDDEFTCVSCFLVKHRLQFDHEASLGPVCKECAA